MYIKTLLLCFFTSHSSPASMAPGSLYVAGAAVGNCGWTAARGGAAWVLGISIKCSLMNSFNLFTKIFQSTFAFPLAISHNLKKRSKTYSIVKYWSPEATVSRSWVLSCGSVSTLICKESKDEQQSVRSCQKGNKNTGLPKGSFGSPGIHPGIIPADQRLYKLDKQSG